MKRVKDRSLRESFLLKADQHPGSEKWFPVELVDTQNGEYIVRRSTGERIGLDGYEHTKDL